MADDETAVPVRRIAPEPLVAEVNERTGSGLRLVGMADHGESGGAAYVSWPDGRPGVITRTRTPISILQQTAEVLEELSSQGLPVPRHDAVLVLSDGAAAVIQERLPGKPTEHADAAVIEAVVAMNEQFANALAERPDVPVPPLYLRHSGPAYWRHHTLAGYSDRSRDVLHRIHQIGADAVHEMAGSDLVHPDYTLGNVLFDPTGSVSGVVDWNGGLARGDRHFALVGLFFDLAWSTLYDGGDHGVHQSAIDRLDAILTDTLDPTRLRRYWAHWTLSRLDWTISNFPAADIELFLQLGESRL